MSDIMDPRCLHVQGTDTMSQVNVSTFVVPGWHYGCRWIKPLSAPVRRALTTTEEIAAVDVGIWNWTGEIQHLAIQVGDLKSFTSDAIREMWTMKFTSPKKLTMLLQHSFLAPTEFKPSMPEFQSWSLDIEKETNFETPSDSMWRQRQIAALRMAELNRPELWWGKVPGLTMRVLAVFDAIRNRSMEHEDFYRIVRPWFVGDDES
ncbi:hypothetical protein IFR05_004237 [Cadophora sp. M221]|nr:hypothetical protein IFR05_004237 [Cadophora sp. M221]